MRRFMGMMPSSEIEIERTFTNDSISNKITVQAGKNGWTIIHGDRSSTYQDMEQSTEDNWRKAFKTLKGIYPNCVECKGNYLKGEIRC